jgi:hypothetical protein
VQDAAPRPTLEGSAGKLRIVVGGNIDALVTEVVRYRQTLDAPAIDQATSCSKCSVSIGCSLARFWETVVLPFQFLQPFGVRYVHAAEFGPPLVEGGVREVIFSV